MKLKSIIRMALAETRRSHGKLLFCVFSIAIGVGSVTTVRTVIYGLKDSIAAQARTLMGADMLVMGNQPLTDKVSVALSREVKERGGRKTDITEFYSML